MLFSFLVQWYHIQTRKPFVPKRMAFSQRFLTIAQMSFSTHLLTTLGLTFGSGLDWTVLTKWTVVNGKMELHLAALDHSVCSTKFISYFDLRWLLRWFELLSLHGKKHPYLKTVGCKLAIRASLHRLSKRYLFFEYHLYCNPRSHNYNCFVRSNGVSVFTAGQRHLKN